MHAKTKMIALILAAGSLLAGSAQAQDTIGIYADFGEGLAPSVITKPGTPFDVVVVAHTDESSAAMEFVMTELIHLYAGVFKLKTDKINNTPLDLGDNQMGEYLMAYRPCPGPGPTEMVRIRYYDLEGEIGENVVLQLRGFQPGDSKPSTFDGQPGYVTCESYEARVLTGVEWDDSSGIDPMLIPGVESTDGIVVLNPVGISVAGEFTSVGAIKSRF